MNIIFLDIDGPMIPSAMFLIDQNASYGRKFSPICIAVANEMCRVSNANIVFNTTHNRDADELREAIYTQGLNPGYVHSDSHTRYPNVGRGLAIKEWLANHPEVERWVAIDDVKCADGDNMILVDPDVGIHVGTLYQVCNVFGGTPPVYLSY
jgi:hypothetical protein